MKRLFCILICVCLLATTGSRNESYTKSHHSTDFIGAENFTNTLFVDYLKSQDFENYKITKTALSMTPKDDNHVVCVYEAEATTKNGQYVHNIVYGYDMESDGHGSFTILHKGNEVNDSFLYRQQYSQQSTPYQATVTGSALSGVPL